MAGRTRFWRAEHDDSPKRNPWYKLLPGSDAPVPAATTALKSFHEPFAKAQSCADNNFRGSSAHLPITVTRNLFVLFQKHVWLMGQVHELGRIAAAIRKLQHDYTRQRLIGLREMCEENADSLLPLDAKREFVKIFEKYVRTRDHISELGDILREALMERERNEADAKQKVIQTKLSVCYDKGYESEGEAERYPGFNRKGKSTNTNTKPDAASKQPAQPAQPQKRKHEATKPINKKKQASQKNEKSVKPQPQPRLQRHNPPPSRNVDPRIKRDSPSDSSPSGSSYSKSEDEAPRKHPKTNTSSALPSRPFNRAEHGWPLVKAETPESEDEEPHRKKSKHNARRR